MTQAVPVNASNSLLQAGHGPSIRPPSQTFSVCSPSSAASAKGDPGPQWLELRRRDPSWRPRGQRSAPFHTRTHYALRMDGTFSIELIELLLDLASQLVCVTSCNRHRQGHS